MLYSDVVHPLSKTQSARSSHGHARYKQKADERDTRRALSHLCHSKGVREIGGDYQPGAGQNRYSEDEEVPPDHERCKVVESDLGPLIETALERHQAIEKDYGGGKRKVERDDREDPEDVLVVAQPRGPADPERSDDEHNLRQDQVEQSELFFEDSTAFFNITLDFSDAGGGSGLCGINVHRWRASAIGPHRRASWERFRVERHRA
jgi:hypothetical protein